MFQFVSREFKSVKNKKCGVAQLLPKKAKTTLQRALQSPKLRLSHLTTLNREL